MADACIEDIGFAFGRGPSIPPAINQNNNDKITPRTGTSFVQDSSRPTAFAQPGRQRFQVQVGHLPDRLVEESIAQASTHLMTPTHASDQQRSISTTRQLETIQDAQADASSTSSHASYNTAKTSAATPQANDHSKTPSDADEPDQGEPFGAARNGGKRSRPAFSGDKQFGSRRVNDNFATGSSRGLTVLPVHQADPQTASHANVAQSDALDHSEKGQRPATSSIGTKLQLNASELTRGSRGSEMVVETEANETAPPHRLRSPSDDDDVLMHGPDTVTRGARKEKSRVTSAEPSKHKSRSRKNRPEENMMPVDHEEQDAQQHERHFQHGQNLDGTRLRSRKSDRQTFQGPDRVNDSGEHRSAQFGQSIGLGRGVEPLQERLPTEGRAATTAAASNTIRATPQDIQTQLMNRADEAEDRAFMGRTMAPPTSRARFVQPAFGEARAVRGGGCGTPLGAEFFRQTLQMNQSRVTENAIKSLQDQPFLNADGVYVSAGIATPRKRAASLAPNVVLAAGGVYPRNTPRRTGASLAFSTPLSYRSIGPVRTRQISTVGSVADASQDQAALLRLVMNAKEREQHYIKATGDLRKARSQLWQTQEELEAARTDLQTKDQRITELGAQLLGPSLKDRLNTVAVNALAQISEAKTEITLLKQRANEICASHRNAAKLSAIDNLHAVVTNTSGESKAIQRNVNSFKTELKSIKIGFFQELAKQGSVSDLLRKELEMRGREIRNQTEELSRIETQRSNLEAQCADANSVWREKVALDVQLLQCKSDLATAQDNVRRLGEEAEANSTKLQAEINGKARLDQKVAEIEQARAALQEELNRDKQSVKLLSDQITQKEASLNSLDDDVRRLETKVTTLCQEQSALDTQLRTSQQQSDDLQGKLQDATKQYTMELATTAALTKDKAYLVKQNQEQSGAISVSESQIQLKDTTINKSIKQKQADLEKQIMTTQTAEAKVTELEKQVKDSASKNAGLQDEVKLSSDAAAVAAQSLSESEKAQDECRTELAAAKRCLDDRQRELDQAEKNVKHESGQRGLLQLELDDVKKKLEGVHEAARKAEDARKVLEADLVTAKDASKKSQAEVTANATTIRTQKEELDRLTRILEKAKDDAFRAASTTRERINELEEKHRQAEREAAKALEEVQIQLKTVTEEVAGLPERVAKASQTLQAEVRLAVASPPRAIMTRLRSSAPRNQAGMTQRDLISCQDHWDSSSCGGEDQADSRADSSLSSAPNPEDDEEDEDEASAVIPALAKRQHVTTDEDRSSAEGTRRTFAQLDRDTEEDQPEEIEDADVDMVADPVTSNDGAASAPARLLTAVPARMKSVGAPAPPVSQNKKYGSKKRPAGIAFPSTDNAAPSPSQDTRDFVAQAFKKPNLRKAR